MYNYDIAIIGGGLAGLTQAILLGNQGWNVACIDRDTPDTQSSEIFDIRTTAISWGSRNLLKNANIWQDIEDRAECISDILILDENSPIELEFNATDIEAEGFGWIVDNRDLRDVLFKHVQNNQNITHMTGQSVTDFQNETNHVTVTLANETQINAKLIIGADGRNSFTRDYMNIKTWKRDYNQTALVCLINHEKQHNGLALEHFRSQGPFAVLPFTNDDNGNHRSAIVWTVEGHDAQGWQICSVETFQTAIQTRCGDHYGDINIIGSRAAWPLNVVKAHNYIGDRMVIIAEAAHGMHPIAGQGLNMSLRDIAAMTEILDGVPDPGDQTLLQSYQDMRSRDNWSMGVATDKLNDLFASDFFAVRAARRFGLHAVSRLPFAKKFFMKQAMGATGNLPQLIKEAA
jgi:2-octaprenyl-6-methoxyphenol hydroxylase